MSEVSRRGLFAGALGAAGAGTVSGCRGDAGSSSAPPVPTASPPTGPAHPARRTVGVPSPRPSAVPVSRQPHQPEVVRLGPGERPPQFVVFSWDGAGETGRGLFDRFRRVARETHASMTFFLSGLYVLPRSKRELYHPPHKPVGASDIGYLTDHHIAEVLRQVRAAWLEGHEIGTHFNGHFCDSRGVGTWSPSDWRSEIEQAVSFVTNWRENTGLDHLEPLPFDYTKELVGARTPCLLGQRHLLPTAAALGWRYDASSPGGEQRWPGKTLGLWDFPLQSIPVPGASFSVLSMDYNLMYNQSGASMNGPVSQRPRWRRQATQAYLAGFHRAYATNRAPFFVGNHFEGWNGGIYMDAVEDALREIAAHHDVRLVSFRQLCDWLDAQDPVVLRRLRTLGVGQAPTRWADYTGARTATAGA